MYKYDSLTGCAIHKNTKPAAFFAAGFVIKKALVT